MLGVKTVKLETCGSCGGCLFSFSQTDLEFLCFLFVGSHNHMAPTKRLGRESLLSASKMLFSPNQLRLGQKLRLRLCLLAGLPLL